MTSDLKTSDTLETLRRGDAYMLTVALCYVICKNSEFLNIFHNLTS